MSSLQPTSPHDIFESPKDTDLIIQTSDPVHLYVKKCFLTYHSKFFADRSPDETIFKAEEDCRDMRAILHLCYPMNVAAIPSILEAAFYGSLLSALEKYGMERPVASLRDMVAASEWPREQPLMTFVMARRCNWEDIGRTAAWESLRFPLRAQTSVPELSMISGLDYHCFIEYFWRCADAARDFLKGSGAPIPFKGLADTGGLSLEVQCRFPELLLNDIEHDDLFGKCEGCSGVWDVLLFNRRDQVRFIHPWIRPFIHRALSEVEQCPRIGLSHKSILQDTVVNAWRACPSQTPEMIQTVVKFLDDELESVLRFVRLEVEGW